MYYKEHKTEAEIYRQQHKGQIKINNAAWRQTHRKEIQAYWQSPKGKAKRGIADVKRRALKMDSLIDNNSEAVEAVYKLATSSKRVRCYLCGEWAPVGHRHVDHITPLSKGGPHVSWNLAVVCDKCNLQKGTKPPAEFGLLF